jgi:hypothetical protein
MAPEVVLLFKAKHDRSKDRADLLECLPLKSDVQTAWLAGAIEVVHPSHPWLEFLRCCRTEVRVELLCAVYLPGGALVPPVSRKT